MHMPISNTNGASESQESIVPSGRHPVLKASSSEVPKLTADIPSSFDDPKFTALQSFERVRCSQIWKVIQMWYLRSTNFDIILQPVIYIRNIISKKAICIYFGWTLCESCLILPHCLDCYSDCSTNISFRRPPYISHQLLTFYENGQLRNYEEWDISG